MLGLSNSRGSMVLAGGGGGGGGYSTGHNFYSFGNPNIASEANSSQPPPIVQFRPVRDNQLISSTAPTLVYAKSYSVVENNELLYKILRGETRLVRSVLEVNGFNYTESHDWNVLWSNSVCKNYLYEGLNEYQKINHFPSSNEITRKDKLC